MALYTSKKDIIKIEFFMENFLDITYDGSEKLTHGVMREFLIDKGIVCPKRAIFSKTKKNNVLEGRVLLVKDHVGKTIAYHNPRGELTTLFADIKAETDPVKLEETRRNILKAQNCILLSNGEVVSKNEPEEEYCIDGNRNKHVMLKTRTHVINKRRK